MRSSAADKRSRRQACSPGKHKQPRGAGLPPRHTGPAVNAGRTCRKSRIRKRGDSARAAATLAGWFPPEPAERHSEWAVSRAVLQAEMPDVEQPIELPRRSRPNLVAGRSSHQACFPATAPRCCMSWSGWPRWAGSQGAAVAAPAAAAPAGRRPPAARLPLPLPRLLRQRQSPGGAGSPGLRRRCSPLWTPHRPSCRHDNANVI